MSRTEFNDLKAELQSMREHNAQLQRRIERLEAKAGVPNLTNSSPNADPLDLPSLTVIKLKPKADAPAPLDLKVPVREPSPNAVGEWMAQSSMDSRFEQGMMALRTGNVSGGVQKLRQFAVEHPRDPRADDALYFSGVGLMGLSDYSGAAKVFEQLVIGYPAGNVVLEAMLRLAECRVRLNQLADARAVYHQVQSKYPGTAAASQAEQRLASLRP